ncbi:hypothetical protein QW131_21440 [Roseibium salinum]|nr:hypothetical protein [Roseibium salinum]
MLLFACFFFKCAFSACRAPLANMKRFATKEIANMKINSSTRIKTSDPGTFFFSSPVERKIPQEHTAKSDGNGEFDECHLKKTRARRNHCQARLDVSCKIYCRRPMQLPKQQQSGSPYRLY